MIRRLAFCAAICIIAVIFFAASPQSVPNPADAASLNNLGVAYMNQQLFDKALTYFQDAAKLDPKLAMAQVNCGIALVNLGRVDAAKPVLESAVKRDPKDPNAWYNLGLLRKNSSDSEGAAAAFRQVIEIDPNDPDAWYFLGSAYSQTKQFAQAVDAFQQAIKLSPTHASAEFGLARAYQQSGDSPQARQHIARFQYITQNRLGAAITLAYGEQGKYSLAEESPMAPQRAPAQLNVRFVDVTGQAGLKSEVNPSLVNETNFVSVLGPGACFLDYDGDGNVDIFLPDNGSQGGMSLYRNRGDGRFEDATKKAGLDPTLHALGCAIGDYDNDGFTDVAFTSARRVWLFRNEKNGHFEDQSKALDIQSAGLNLGISFLDFDHDGDLDLYITRYSEHRCFDPHKPDSLICNGAVVTQNAMLRNDGNRAFTEVTAATGLGGERPSIGALASDYNNDRAIDLVIARPVDGALILENPREVPFVKRNSWPTLVSGVGVSAADFNHDGWMDLAFTQWSMPGLTLWRNQHGKSFEPIAFPATNWVRAWNITATDYDNDGWADLVAVGETSDGHGEVKLFRNLGPDGFKDVSADVGLDRILLKDPRSIIVGDYDNDGATDLLITQNHGPAVLLRNEGGNQNHWLRLALKGLNDNKSAIGTKVEVFAGGNRQKFEIAGSNGYLGQNSPYLTVGLGPSTQADIVRMLWPTGVLQDEIGVSGDREQKILEIDRRGSSCPTLFVWDGQRYQLVGDMLGAGVVGHWVAPGERNVPRPTEYIKIDRGSVREKDGKLSFRFMEPLEEAVYLDQVKLVAVDHPAEYEVFPNEYFASNPPFPEFKVVASKDARPPVGAWDEHGHDVIPELLAHRYFGDFEVLPFLGFAKMHSLELELGGPYEGGPLWLLLHGEVEYFSANSMYAADQAGLKPVAPYVEASGSDGKWKRVVDDMGFPAGGARTMTADLSGRLPVGTKRIRISTNLQIYWDSILIDRTQQNVRSRLTSLPLSRADLSFHGFPLKIEGNPPGNVQYVYEKASPTGPYTRPAGAYTRYGDVLPLLTSFDDRLAVFGSGDEVALDFDPATLPALPQGWTRDYFFVANGYEKDMDFYAFQGDRVEPLPFQAMEIYPYPGKSYPLDPVHLNDLLEFNTRQMSGNESPGFSFQYESKKP
jgi:tetratricopeptide (TPR) repeat protein